MSWLLSIPQALRDPFGAPSPLPEQQHHSGLHPLPAQHLFPGGGDGDSQEAVEPGPGPILFLSLLMPHRIMFWV